MDFELKVPISRNSDKVKNDVDFLMNFDSKIEVDINRLEEPLKTIALLVAQKEEVELHRRAAIRLAEMVSEIMRELFDINKRYATILEHAKVHWPGRESAKFELAKMKNREEQLQIFLDYIGEARKKIKPLPELAQKLIEVEKLITDRGGDRLLMGIDNVLKKPSIQRADLLEIARNLK